MPASIDIPFANDPAADTALTGSTHARALTEADAVEIWIARWLRIRPKDLLAKYGCDSRRLYEIWWGEKFHASRAKAEIVFRNRHPGLCERIAFGYRRIPATAAPELERRQLRLFE